MHRLLHFKTDGMHSNCNDEMEFRGQTSCSRTCCDVHCCLRRVAANQRRDEDRLLTGFKECRDLTIRYLADQHGENIFGPLCNGLLLHLHDHLHSICRIGSVAGQLTGKQTVMPMNLSVKPVFR